MALERLAVDCAVVVDTKVKISFALNTAVLKGMTEDSPEVAKLERTN